MILKMKHLLSLCLLTTAAAWAAPFFTTQDLDTKDFEDMRDLSYKEIKKCYKLDQRAIEESKEQFEIDNIDSTGIRQTSEVRNCLKKVVAIVLTRREQNDPVQRELLKKILFEVHENYRIEILSEITKEAIELYKRSDSNKTLQATAYEQIKNLLTEAKSQSVSRKEEVQPILRMIQDANLEVDSKLVSYRANGPSGVTPNLSKKAQEILKSLGN